VKGDWSYEFIIPVHAPCFIRDHEVMLFSCALCVLALFCMCVRLFVLLNKASDVRKIWYEYRVIRGHH